MLRFPTEKIDLYQKKFFGMWNNTWWPNFEAWTAIEKKKCSLQPTTPSTTNNHITGSCQQESISDVFSAVFVEDVSDLTLQSNFALLAQLEIKPYLVKQISWFNI